MLQRWATVVVLLGAGISTLVVLVSLGTGLPGQDRAVGAIVDASLPATLPTWWSTALFTTGAVAHGLVACVTRWTGARGAARWAVGAAALAALSVEEHTTAVDGSGIPFLPIGAVIASGGVLLLVAATVRGRPGRLLASGAGAVMISLGGADVLARAVGDPIDARTSVLLHAAELAEDVGALVLVTGALSALSVRRCGGSLLVEPAAGPVPGTASPGRFTGGRGPLLLLGTATASLSVASLVAVLVLPELRELRLFLDVLVEDNLPTWWSAALLLTAALAHAAVAAAGWATGHADARYWIATAAVLALLSLDDHTQLHERTEQIGRWLLDAGSYPFLWLLPGAVAGAGVACAVVVTAVRAPRRARRLLISGVAVLLFCALGLEAVQGLFMAAGDEGLPFVLTYHVEELGENVAALLLLAAAGAAVHVGPGGRALAVGYAGRARSGSPRGTAVPAEVRPTAPPQR